MLFERYAVKLKKNNNIHNIFDINFQNEKFEDITIDNISYQIFRNHFTYEFNNATFENLIVIFTKPTIIHNINDRDLYKLKIAYVKTKNNQTIVNVQNWDVVNHLDQYQGLIDFIDIYIMPYDNTAKIAIEYKYNSIAPSVMFQMIQNIMINGFICFGINYDEDLELVKDYLQTDFEETFNSSRKNKKIILYMDTINNGTETINSAKIEYSVKSDITFENAFNYLTSNYSDNIQRYSIKCEDEDFKTASIDGESEDLRTNEWSKPARIHINYEDTNNIYASVANFLKFNND
ncbi:hypothetical protein N5T57_02785 [Aliarcobacter cryaerophilus]|uniref:hypothetical protein n=1 Tax=Aliarcobacter cryaerophilus TaxID=28198 RepID=UPI0021B35ED7|nr:hypothetical protein [Aliarcobacter cryaerophilus]MCT7521859.1 hypothetical protein [Aliarcobacter cryaerophilus]